MKNFVNSNDIDTNKEMQGNLQSASNIKDDQYESKILG